MNFWEHIIKLNDYSGMLTLIQTIGTILLAIITIRLSWKANKMSNRAIEISEEALRVSKLAIEVSRELAQLPYKKDLWMSSYLDIENDKYILSLRIVNVGNAAVQIDEIHITSGDESKIEYVEVDDGYVEIPFSGQIELAHKWNFNKYIIPQRDLKYRFVLQNCSVQEEYENEIHILVVDSEGKEYRTAQDWAVG